MAESGLKTMSLKTVRRVLRTERDHQRDVYQNMTHVTLGIEDGLAPLHERFNIDLHADGCRGPLSFSETAVQQLCRIAGIPHAAIERMPAALGMSVLRCMLEIAGPTIDKLFLFRLKENSAIRRVRAILPASYIRCDDSEVLETIIGSIGTAGNRVSNVTVKDNLFAIRVLLPDHVDFGTAQSPDKGRLGVDVRSSETGSFPTEIRHLVHRLICSNGMTTLSQDGRKEVRRTGRLDPDGFRRQLGTALSRTLPHGRQVARVMMESHHDYLDDPVGEIAYVFNRHRLGRPQGKLGRWVTTELIREQNLMGVRRFDVVNAFTAVARNLEHHERVKVEDAVTSYLLEMVGQPSIN